MFLIMSLDNEVYENGNGVNGPKISKIAWVLEENGNQVVYEIKAIERYSCIVSQIKGVASWKRKLFG